MNPSSSLKFKEFLIGVICVCVCTNKMVLNLSFDTTGCKSILQTKNNS